MLMHLSGGVTVVTTPEAVEQHRHECEVRWVVALPTNDRRAAYLAGVRERRGDVAGERLRRDAWALMKEGR